MSKKLTTKEFIEKAKKIHGDTYDYSSVRYISSRVKVTIECLKHGFFEQLANSHLQGSGCTECGKNKKALTTKEFIEKAKKIHGDTYDYSKIDYKGAHKKVEIICRKHGSFYQKPYSHLNGSGCSKCANNYSYSKEELLKKFKLIHKDEYDYSLVEYVNNSIKVKIICLEHGVFKQTPNTHLKGGACPKCGLKKRTEKRTYDKKTFVSLANKVHENKYSYFKTEYINSKTKIIITCPKHGDFEQMPYSHLQGFQCTKCSMSSKSIKEKELLRFLSKNLICLSNSRDILKNKHELDIFIPSKNIAIEFNGNYYHSDKFKENNYHLQKTILCREKNIQLIHIFEDEWVNKKEIVKSRLRNLIGRSKNRIFARKCVIKLTSTKEKTKFLNDNHIQGAVGSTINLGLYFEEKLVSLMTFGKLRKNLGSKNKHGSWELLRFCNKLNTNVTGGFSKLLKHFQKNYEYKEIISYCDLRWSIGDVYLKNGFKEVSKSSPNYFYVNSKSFSIRENRFKYRKSELLKKGWGRKDQTEKEIMQEKGFHRIYDCGTIKFKI